MLEAIKGVAERIRNLSGLTTGGTELVNTAFSVKAPILTLNSLSTETEISEQKGFGNILVGLFGAVRNPSAHAPKITWPMTQQDALDVLSLVSFVHRKLMEQSKSRPCFCIRANNAINSGSQKRRFALLLAAGYGGR